jgi:hypothetical protein
MQRLPEPGVQIASDEYRVRNAELPWDEFDPDSYFRHNYRDLRDDDRTILEGVRDFFAAMAPDGPVHGLDVGTGPNLYPVLAMLPWCDTITLMEHSAPNIAWLRDEVRSYSPSWDEFWDLLLREPRYRIVADPRAALAERVIIQQGSVFQLPAGQWDIGTMFFVACSISAHHAEFEQAVGRFLGALRPGALFAMAYMEGSLGYDVGSRRFPAVSINVADVQKCLENRTNDLVINRIDIGPNLLREGYTGMLLALGRLTSG